MNIAKKREYGRFIVVTVEGNKVIDITDLPQKFLGDRTELPYCWRMQARKRGGVALGNGCQYVSKLF